jgi:glycine oxidase
MSAFDVVVVGGGLIGSLSALRLAESGRRVLVLEKAVPGAEASSAAAGILAAQSESRADGPMFELALESRERYASLVEELRARVGMDVGFRRTGVAEIAETPEQLDALEQTYAWQRAKGHRVERAEGAALRALEPGLNEGFHGALVFADDAQLEPIALVTAIAQAAERAGVVFRPGTTARGVRVEHGVAVGVDVEEECILAGHVVVAAGAWSGLVRGATVSTNAVKPARGQIVELVTRTPPVSRVVFGRGGYVVPRADGRVLCGSTLEFVGFQRDVTAAGVAKILAMAMGLVPALANAKMARTWANFRPWSADGAPLVGDAGVRGLTLATGHHRSGILLAPATAERVRAHVIDGRVEPEAPWTPTRESRANDSGGRA